MVQRLLTIAFLLAALGSRSRRLMAAECAADAGAERWIVAFPAEVEPGLRAEGVEIWDRDEGVVIGGAGPAALQSLAELKIEPRLRLRDEGQWIYLLSHAEGFAAPLVPEAATYTLGPTSALYLLPPDRSFELPRARPFGGFRGVPRIGLPESKPHAADIPAPRSIKAADDLKDKASALLGG